MSVQRWGRPVQGFEGTPAEWRKRVQGVSFARRRTSVLSRELGIPEPYIRFWRAKKGNLKYESPIHRACANALASMRNRVPELPRPGLRELMAWMGVTGYCSYTGEELYPAWDLSVDHIVPLSRGGGNVRENLALVHIYTNQYKGNLTGQEFVGLIRLASTWPAEARVDFMARLRAGGRRW